MMRFLLTLGLLLAFSSIAYSQLSDGSDAPDFDLEDLDGVPHVLHDYLADGKGAILDFSATWCPPCWSYHNTGTLENVWNTYGPSGSDETMVFFIEPDPSTSQNCIYGPSGCTGGSLGNWTIGVDYPILNPDSGDASGINGDFNINYYPTLYAVGPNYKIYETGQISYSEWGNWIESFSLEADYEILPNDGCSYVDVEIEATGGYGNLFYTWSNGETGPLLEEALPGTYTAVVRDNNGYEVEVGPFTVSAGNIIAVGLDDMAPVSCYGEQDGFIEVYGIDGSDDFSYDWNNGADTYYNEDLGPGDYTVLVTDNVTGCTAEETYTIEEPDLFTAEVASLPADCDGLNGTLEIDVDGGVGSIIYFINGQPYYQPTIENLEAGSYSVFIKDQINCSVTLSADIDQPLVPEVDTISPKMITCGQQMISLSADSSSIGEHIIYTWDLDTLAIDTGFVIQTDTFGLFTLTVKDTLSTCFDDLTFMVSTDTIAPGVSVSSLDDVLTCDLTSTTLTGTSDTESSTFSWTAADEEVIGENESLEISAPGTYTVAVTDTLNGCSTTESIGINENLDVPTITLDQISDINCENTTGTISVESDQQATYEWTSEDGTIVGDAANVVVESAGQYTVESTSTQTGCSSYQTFEVTSSTDVPNVNISEPLLLTCDQESTTLEAAEVDGYVYEWIDDQGNLVGEGSSYETNVPGDFTLYVTDSANGCSKIITVNVEQNVDQPQIVLESKGALDCIELEADVVVEELMNHSYTWTTNNGTIVSGQESNSLRVSSAGKYKLVLTNLETGCNSQRNYNVTENTTSPDVQIEEAETLTCNLIEVMLIAEDNDEFTYEWTTENGSINGNENKSTLNVNTAGTYFLETTNVGNGCTSTQSIEVMENVELPAIEVVTIGSVDCSGTNAMVTLAEDENLEYLWSALSGSIVGLQTGSTIEVDQAGQYEVTVTDKINGCQAIQLVEVEYSQAPPEINLTGETLICVGGSTTLCMTTSGGDTQWTIDGNIIGTQECVEVNQASIVEATSTNSLGCTTTEMISIEEFAFPEFNTIGDDVELDCVTPSVSVSYELDSDLGFSANWSASDGTLIGESTAIEITQAGIYTLTLVNDETGCFEQKTVEIVEDDASLPVFEMSSSGLLTQEFSYQSDEHVDSQVWSFGDGVTSEEMSPSYTYIVPGYYEVCLTTTNKCGEHVECNQILAAEPIGITDQTTDLICHSVPDGSISLDLLDGLEPYGVTWTGPNGYVGEGLEISGLEAGDYQANVSDAGITEEVLEFTLTEPSEIAITSETVVEETIGLSDGSISIEASGGTGELSYVWNHGPTTPTVDGLAEGDYTVTIMDANGCFITTVYTVQGVVSSVNTIDGLSHFEVTPNPTTGLVTLTIEMDQRQDLSFSLIDISGKVYRQNTLTSESESIKMDLSDLSDGIYIMRLTNGKQVTSRRIVVLR